MKRAVLLANPGGMPIVERPADALECFARSPGIDVLFVGRWRVDRS
jgi:predicted NodU family carbamoyl transferase